MKKLILFMHLMVSTTMVFTAEFKSGDNPVVSNPVYDDLYIAGGMVSINAPIYGDLITAGGTINVNDTVLKDILVAGGNITISAFVGDDIRIAGGTVIISGLVAGDVVAAGGKVTFTKTAKILGDLIVAGGEVIFEGILDGALKVKAGNFTLIGTVSSGAEVSAENFMMNGSISGKSTIAVKTLTIGEQAAFDGDIEYWTSEGQVDFSPYHRRGTATYNESLEMEDRKFPGWIFIIIYVLTALLLIFVAQVIIKGPAARAGVMVKSEPAKSIGYGMLYLIGVPLLAILLMFTVIAIPLSLIALNFYLVTVLLGHIISSVVYAQWLNQQNRKNWNKFTLFLVSSGIYLVLMAIFFIPFLGFLANLLIVSLAFGAILLQYRSRNRVSVEME